MGRKKVKKEVFVESMFCEHCKGIEEYWENWTCHYCHAIHNECRAKVMGTNKNSETCIQRYERIELEKKEKKRIQKVKRMEKAKLKKEMKEKMKKSLPDARFELAIPEGN